MRTIGVVALTLILGSVVEAQALKPAALVGRWIEVGDTTGSSTDLHADSTFIVTSIERRPKGDPPPGVLLSDRAM